MNLFYEESQERWKQNEPLVCIMPHPPTALLPLNSTISGRGLSGRTPDEWPIDTQLDLFLLKPSFIRHVYTECPRYTRECVGKCQRWERNRLRTANKNGEALLTSITCLPVREKAVRIWFRSKAPLCFQSNHWNNYALKELKAWLQSEALQTYKPRARQWVSGAQRSLQRAARFRVSGMARVIQLRLMTLLCSRTK